MGMLKRHGIGIAFIAAAVIGAGLATISARQFHPTTAAGTLSAFASEDQFRAFFRERNRVQRMEEARYQGEAAAAAVELNIMPAPADAPADSITNTQEAGVDEGGIVKAAGDHLVVLRRGRLFTLTVAGGLRAVDSIDVSPPGSRSRDRWSGSTWYDEMLVAGDQVVVIGYSYEREGSEIIRFHLSPEGMLTFQDAYRLDASDYYSAENYASRLIGNELVLYNVRYIWRAEEPMRLLPKLRDETPGRTGDPELLARPEDVFVDPKARPTDLNFNALHSVTRCDLTAPRLRCWATAILGPSSRTFYVSSKAIYVWTSMGGERPGDGSPTATIYRMPLDGGRPQAVQASGAPLDQFSFREDAKRRRLDIVVQSNGGGDGMWSRNSRDGRTALLSLPLDRFGNGTGAARASDYRALPELPDEGWGRENRFVGDYLLYAADRPLDAEGARSGGVLLTLNLDNKQTRTFDLPAPVTRIEAMGADALVVTGEAQAMSLTAIELGGSQPSLGARQTINGTAESETRSHGFFYRPDRGGMSGGLLGLPVERFPGSSDQPQLGGGVDMLFLRRGAGTLARLGALSTFGPAKEDHCRVSCIDWYGAARPIFLQGRIFALMGYELVEGREESGRIREIGRLDFTPRT